MYLVTIKPNKVITIRQPLPEAHVQQLQRAEKKYTCVNTSRQSGRQKETTSNKQRGICDKNFCYNEIILCR